MKLRSASLTDIGRVRRENEDTAIIEPSLGLFGVADGVGGLPGGAEASFCAADTLITACRAGNRFDPQALVNMVQQANAAVVALGERINPSFGIGTTLTCGLFREDLLTVLHVGDSRAFLLRGKKFTQITEDHSVENEARLRRERGEPAFLTDHNRNALTRCIGQPTPPEVDVSVRPVAPGDRYLFTSDGITRFVEERELAEFISVDRDPHEVLRAMVNLANDRGGADNSTAVLVIVDSLKP